MAALFVDRHGSFSLCDLLQQEQAMADTLSRSNKVLPAITRMHQQHYQPARSITCDIWAYARQSHYNTTCSIPTPTLPGTAAVPAAAGSNKHTNTHKLD